MPPSLSCDDRTAVSRNHFQQLVSLKPSENSGKYLLLWYFQGVKKETNGIKWIKTSLKRIKYVLNCYTADSHLLDTKVYLGLCQLHMMELFPKKNEPLKAVNYFYKKAQSELNHLT